jgi:hypothetical protein
MGRLVVVLEVDADPRFDGAAFVADSVLLRPGELPDDSGYPKFAGRRIALVHAEWAHLDDGTDGGAAGRRGGSIISATDH